MEESLAMAPVVAFSVTTPERVGWQGIESIAPYVVIGVGNGGYPFLRCFRELVPEGLAGKYEGSLL